MGTEAKGLLEQNAATEQELQVDTPSPFCSHAPTDFYCGTELVMHLLPTLTTEKISIEELEMECPA